MFIREKVDQMRATGHSFKEICEFQRAYSDGIAQGKTQAEAMAFAETTTNKAKAQQGAAARKR